MAFNCPSCKARVYDHSALCDNRNDPAKEFGCPNCGTFYFLRTPYSNRYKQHAKNMLFFGAGFVLDQYFDLTSFIPLLIWATLAAFLIYPATHYAGLVKLKPTPYKSPNFHYSSGGIAWESVLTAKPPSIVTLRFVLTTMTLTGVMAARIAASIMFVKTTTTIH